jgi:hypothetical protein
MLRSHELYEADANALATGNAPPVENSHEPEGLFASAVPASFLKLTGRLQQRIDRTLGYFGQSRFVFFYYEPRGQEVIWNDGRSYGFATGGWQTFGEQVIPLARSIGAHVGDIDARGDHVLLVDRVSGQAYFAPKDHAVRVVDAQ